jgi:AraC-like DNA-binding protein
MFYSCVSQNPGKTYLISKIIINILLELVIEKGSPGSESIHAPDYLQKIKYNFDYNYHSNYSLDMLEQEYKVSKYRICRDFMKFYNVSPMKYLNDRRIEAVKDALVNTDKQINEICQLAGFDNTNSLIRLFKMKTGITPMTFRRQPPAYDFMDMPII